MTADEKARASVEASDAIAYCSGEFPCEASTAAASLEHELCDLRTYAQECEAACVVPREALEEIARGRGQYSLDPLEHAANTIEDMKALATTALAATAGAELAAAVRALLEVGVDIGKNLGCTCPKPCPRCLLAYRQLADALASPALRPFHRA